MVVRERDGIMESFASQKRHNSQYRYSDLESATNRDDTRPSISKGAIHNMYELQTVVERIHYYHVCCGFLKKRAWSRAIKIEVQDEEMPAYNT